MNSATRVASGSKPSQLKKPVPSVNTSAVVDAEVDAAIDSLPDRAPASGQETQADIEAQILAEMNGQTQAAPGVQSPIPDPEYPIDARQQPRLNLVDPGTATANVVEQGLPMAVSTAGTILGAAAGGAGSGGLGVGVGAEMGNAGAAAVNVALAPFYKKAADGLRKAWGIPTQDKSDFDQRIQMALSEAVGLAIPRFFAQNPYVRDYVGNKLNQTASKEVAKNIDLMQTAKDKGIDLGPRGLMNSTPYESYTKEGLSSQMTDVSGVANTAAYTAQKENLDAVTTAFNKLKDTVGKTTDEAGNLIIKPENVSARKEAIGRQIGRIDDIAIKEAGDRKFDVAPILDSIKQALQVRGIETTDGLIPAKVMNKLEPEARALARQHNNIMGEALADTVNSSQPQLSLQRINRLTKNFQDLAEFDIVVGRDLANKQYGSISREARMIRENAMTNVLDEAAARAEQAGNADGARQLRSLVNKRKSLGESFGQHSDAAKDFYKAVNDDPRVAARSLINNLGDKEFKNMVGVLEEKERQALGSSYVENLINNASDNGVLVDPKSIKKALTKDGPKVEQLLGAQNYKDLQDLTDLAMTAEKIEVGGHASDTIVQAFAKKLGAIRSASAFNFLENILLRTPKISDLVENTPAYKAAFERYNSSMLPSDRVKDAADLVGYQVGGKAVPKAVQGAVETKKDRERSKMKSYELQYMRSDQ
jgi:hypothetical protein